MSGRLGNVPRQHNQNRGLTRGVLTRIANETMKAIESGSYTLGKPGSDSDTSERFDLKENVENLKANTLYCGPDSRVSSWSTQSYSPEDRPSGLKIGAMEKTTLDTAHWLLQKLAPESTERPEIRAHAVGVLNFASARKPGGGFLTGAQAQEESIARSSTLYSSLTCPAGQQFYSYNHSITNGKNDGYYSHAMIYSPSVLVFRNDAGGWMPPYEIDILTSPAVNAGVVRQKRKQALDRRQKADSESVTEAKIRAVMKERMARLLYLFEMQGVRNLVLGSFGTGVFKNNVDMVVELWAELLVGENARFGKSFERVVFGVIGHETYVKFANKFGTMAV